jgi:hypothetical protein
MPYARNSCTIYPAQYILLPDSTTYFTLKSNLAFFRFADKNIPAIRFAMTWEDGKKHATTQDYADMLGWDDMAALVNKAYQ